MFAVRRPRIMSPVLLLGPALLGLCPIGPARGDSAAHGSPSAGEPFVWSSTIWSPHPQSGAGGANVARLDQAPVVAACRSPDAALVGVAAELAARVSAAPETELLAWSLRAAGSPYVRPRALVLSGKRIEAADAATRVGAWLETNNHQGQRRCGTAAARRADGTEVVTAIAVDAEADMDPLPVRARVGSWITLNATALVPATGAKLVVLGPSGPPRTVPTSFAQGRVVARANVDRAGPWTFQLLLSTGLGPHPVLEATVFAGVDPPTTFLAQQAPGESAQRREGDPAARLFEMMNAARASEGIAELGWDRELGRVAARHARHMLDARRLGHDVGDGDPEQRVESSGIVASDVGENVAHALDPSMAHRAVWSSPSHRANLLDQRFGRVGVGVANDADGTVWVACLFAAAR
jgi:uncharacterized protein YkwD